MEVQLQHRRRSEGTLRLKELANPQPKPVLWTHSQFLSSLIGKFVVLTPKGEESGYYGVLIAFDQWSLLVDVIHDDKGNAERTLVFKHSIDAVLAYNPELHGKLPGASA